VRPPLARVPSASAARRVWPTVISQAENDENPAPCARSTVGKVYHRETGDFAADTGIRPYLANQVQTNGMKSASPVAAMPKDETGQSGGEKLCPREKTIGGSLGKSYENLS
jgi:hypothetical protein